MIGDQVKALRTLKDETQTELAKSIGCSRNHIIDIERNKVCPSVRDLHLFADHFDVSSDYLLGRDCFVVDPDKIEEISELKDTVASLMEMQIKCYESLLNLYREIRI